jgi:hypothetical protein
LHARHDAAVPECGALLPLPASKKDPPGKQDGKCSFDVKLRLQWQQCVARQPACRLQPALVLGNQTTMSRGVSWMGYKTIRKAWASSVPHRSKTNNMITLIRDLHLDARSRLRPSPLVHDFCCLFLLCSFCSHWRHSGNMSCLAWSSSLIP